MRGLIMSTIAAGILILVLGSPSVQALGPPSNPHGDTELACLSLDNAFGDVNLPDGTQGEVKVNELFDLVGVYCAEDLSDFDPNDLPPGFPYP